MFTSSYPTIRRQHGISLVELILFIVIVSVALMGILSVMNVTTRGSADPLIHKQALAIAESLLEEVELMPFTYCDPNDINAASAVSPASCTAGLSQDVFTGSVPATEARGSTTDPYDNVADYSNYNISPVTDITGAPITGLGGYSASVNVSNTTLPNVAAGDALLIAVTVTGPNGLPVAVEGIRTRYAPRAVP